MGAQPTRLEFRGLSVEFGATMALKDISVAIRPGEIVGLLGHNGAGKTTLFNVAAGVVPATRGSFLVDGVEVMPGVNPVQVAALGITIIHQEPALAANLSVLDNLYLGRTAPRYRPERDTAAREALARVGASDLPLDRPVETLGLGQRQLVDLARGLLSGEMKVLLLDEPTAALGQAETQALHSLIRAFASQGVAVVYVSHRLPDILEVCQRILVLRAGELVVDGRAADFTPKALASALIPDIGEAAAAEAFTPGPVVLSLSRPYRLEFREGEVVGLFGMAGGEQFDLLERMFGLKGSFELELDGKRRVISSPSHAIRDRIFLVPADREKDGLISGMSASDNVYLPWYKGDETRGLWISGSSGDESYKHARAELNILGPGRAEPIDEFSGGNRQKHLLARWMFPREPRALLLAQPTQGVDVGAKVDIARVIRQAARNGNVAIVASAESDEISAICDRAYVLVGDEVQELSKTSTFDEDLLATLLQLANLTNNAA